MNPVPIIQIKPGNLPKGIKKVRLGKTRLRDDNSAKAAVMIPNQTSHRGINFAKPEVTEIPARSNPNAATCPTPPVANANSWNARMGFPDAAIPGCDSTHPVSPETARKIEEANPPNRAMFTPAPVIP